MRSLFYRFGRNLGNIFRIPNLVWHSVAIIGTFLIVLLNFDWTYYQFFRSSHLYPILFAAAALGGLVPILVPLGLLLVGKIRKNSNVLNTGFALGQAVIIGVLVSSLYKALTGRAHPDPIRVLTTDITHVFKFGFLRAGVFWGWPSSHTTIAFAMAFTLWALYPQQKTLKFLTLLYALFIGIGVSITIHWFSDFFAGAIIGTLIGTTVGRAYFKINIQ
jgi:membrane-associated phospholipid phosphatase